MFRQKRLLSIAVVILLISLPIFLLLLRERVNLVPQAEFAEARFSFSPSSLTLIPGQSSEVNLFLDTGEISLSAVDISLTYDPNVLSVTEITPNLTDVFTDSLINEKGSGTARLAAVSRKTTTELPSGNLRLATLVVTGAGLGQSSLTLSPRELVAFNPASANEADVRLTPAGSLTLPVSVSSPGTSPTQQPTLPPGTTVTSQPTSPPGATLTPTATVTQVPTIPPNTPQITFRTGFVGLSQSQPDLTVRLTVADAAAAVPITNSFLVNLTSNGSFVYTPVNSPVSIIGSSSGTGKTLLVKGPKHLQKKMEDRITLSAGTNPTFDWTASQLKMEPGDLPDPNNNMQQDGVINSVDVGMLVSRIGSTSQSDLEIADLNYDGIVNANDLSLLIETLSTRYDDEY